MTDALLNAARGSDLLIAALFALAALHKVRTLQRGAAAEEPLFAVSEWRQKRARSLLGLASLAEAALVVALLIWPAQAAVASATVTAFYLWELRRLPPDVPCNCLGAALELPSRRLEVARNMFLISLAVGVVATRVAVGALPGPSQAIVGSVAIVLMIAVGFSQFLALRARMSAPGATLGRRSGTGELEVIPRVEVVSNGRSSVA